MAQADARSLSPGLLNCLPVPLTLSTFIPLQYAFRKAENLKSFQNLSWGSWVQGTWDHCPVFVRSGEYYTNFKIKTIY